MGTITPILDSLLPQVHGRSGDAVRAARRVAHGPLSELRPVDVELRVSPRGEDAGNTGRSLNPSGRTAKGSVAADSQAMPGETEAVAGKLTHAGKVSAILHLTQGGSALARLLATLGKTGGQGPEKATNPLTDGTGKPRPGMLAERLAEQMVTSGQFYEAHLAQWIRGRYPTERLFEEPQAQLGGSGPEKHHDKGDKASADNRRHTGLDLRMATLVGRQLEALTTGVLSWRGDAWPGAEMDWSLHEEAPGEDSGDESEPGWATSLALQLRSMGRFEARLQLVGERISVTAWVEPGAGRKLAASDLETLRQRLKTAGFASPSVRLLDDEDAS